ncbi:MAG: 2'-5' RNA ligase family protein [Butyrivibrio sp.]|nr:2'-5' RNA ligase family protein [Butyrivibrio sp.]
MLRTIMIFPQFENIEIIDEIRGRYDPLAKLVRPHITLVFPFESEITNDEIEEKLTSSLKDVRPFELTLHGFSKTDDNYLFLNIEKGKETIEAIHDDLYSNYFKDYYLPIPYSPHMTVGKLKNAQELNDAYEYVKDLDASFKTVVKKISVEMIGEHEESIIVLEKRLENPDM